MSHPYLDYMRGWYCAAGLKELPKGVGTPEFDEGYNDGVLARRLAQSHAQERFKYDPTVLHPAKIK